MIINFCFCHALLLWLLMYISIAGFTGTVTPLDHYFTVLQIAKLIKSHLSLIILGTDSAIHKYNLKERKEY